MVEIVLTRSLALSSKLILKLAFVSGKQDRRFALGDLWRVKTNV